VKYIVRCLLQNGTAVEGPAGSRFYQFFRRESPVNQPESRRSSLQDELLNNIINGRSQLFGLSRLFGLVWENLTLKLYLIHLWNSRDSFIVLSVY